MIVWLVSEMRSNFSSFFSLHQCSCVKNVRTLVPWVFADCKFTYHPESEFVVFAVSKLMKWLFFIVSQGLFRSWITETPITESASWRAKVTSLACVFVAQNDWLSVQLMLKKTSNQDVQYVLHVWERIVLTISDMILHGSAHLHWCPHAVAYDDTSHYKIDWDDLSNVMFRKLSSSVLPSSSAHAKYT